MIAPKFSLEKILGQIKIGALLITDRTNIKYLTGFSGVSTKEREVFAVVTVNNTYLLTYPVSLQEIMPKKTSYQTLLITPDQKLNQHLLKILGQEKIDSLGFEKDDLTVGEYELWSEKVKTNWIPTRGIIENLRMIKTSGEINKKKKKRKNNYNKLIIKKKKKGGGGFFFFFFFFLKSPIPHFPTTSQPI